jgi:hypothetical protein
MEKPEITAECIAEKANNSLKGGAPEENSVFKKYKNLVSLEVYIEATKLYEEKRFQAQVFMILGKVVEIHLEDSIREKLLSELTDTAMSVLKLLGHTRFKKLCEDKGFDLSDL